MASDSESLLDPVRRLYREGVLTHGASSKAVGWKDEASQRLRFEKLAEVIDDGTEPVTVNDLGCGYGAMFDFLTGRLDRRLAAYAGADISQDMVEAARARVADERATFIHAAALPDEADYSFVSGTFNVKMKAADADWTAHIQETLLALAEKSRRGLAFNLLSTYVDWHADNLFYGEPCAFFDFCRRRISRYVTLVHDYPLYEWTILVRK